MCILFIAVKQHTHYPLIICANRDEFYARPTKKAHFWDDKPGLLAGKDRQAGGTWLGIRGNKFAAVTNLRLGDLSTESNKDVAMEKRSRGELVPMALEHHCQIDLQWLQQHCSQYRPFNLVYGTLGSLRCFNSFNQREVQLQAGVTAISNGAIDEHWPKMERGRRNLERLLAQNSELNKEQLIDLLNDRTQAASDQLPNILPVKYERLLSSIFISSPAYGTRSSNLVLQSKRGDTEFVEIQYDEEGNRIGQNQFHLLPDTVR